MRQLLANPIRSLPTNGIPKGPSHGKIAVRSWEMYVLGVEPRSPHEHASKCHMAGTIEPVDLRPRHTLRSPNIQSNYIRVTQTLLFSQQGEWGRKPAHTYSAKRGHACS